jgi:hypothetical protein
MTGLSGDSNFSKASEVANTEAGLTVGELRLGLGGDGRTPVRVLFGAARRSNVTSSFVKLRSVVANPMLSQAWL